LLRERNAEGGLNHSIAMQNGAISNSRPVYLIKIIMDEKSQSKLGKALLGAGGISVFAALLCCGFGWILAALFATLGISFILQDSFLIPLEAFRVDSA